MKPRLANVAPMNLSFLKVVALCVSACTSFVLQAEDSATPSDRSAPLERIAFGSCNRHDLPQPIWQAVLDFQPGLWIWLGDNIYGDTEDMALLETKWTAQKEQPDYQRVQQAMAITGVWDDHDYGANDGGKDFGPKAASQELLLDFLGVSKDDPRRQQEGIYGWETFGPAGREVAIVLLDVRTHRDPPRSGGDILGTTQWEWLKNQLARSTAQIHVFASGSQILPTEHRFEKWADYPEARERLLALLAKYKTANPVFLSGDRHHAEISRLASPQGPIVEITASGMTHALAKNKNEPNALRVGKVLGELNFGTLEIDWTKGQITAALRDRNGKAADPFTWDLR